MNNRTKPVTKSKCNRKRFYENNTKKYSKLTFKNANKKKFCYSKHVLKSDAYKIPCIIFIIFIWKYIAIVVFTHYINLLVYFYNSFWTMSLIDRRFWLQVLFRSQLAYVIVFWWSDILLIFRLKSRLSSEIPKKMNSERKTITTVDVLLPGISTTNLDVITQCVISTNSVAVFRNFAFEVKIKFEKWKFETVKNLNRNQKLFDNNTEIRTGIKRDR